MFIACPACLTRCEVDGRGGLTATCRCGAAIDVPSLAREAARLECPSCGAPASGEHSRCRYCDCTLAVVACGTCFARVFANARHCGHCGADMSIAASESAAAPSARPCPRCADLTTLIAHRVSTTLLEECHACGGVWLEAQAFRRLVRARDEQLAVIDDGVPPVRLDAPAVTAVATTVRYLRCPDCQQLMNRKNFAQTSGVIVDVCTAHGVWFDRDELGTIVTFVMRGGLGAARKAEIERLERTIQRPIVAFSSAPRDEVGGAFADDLLRLLGHCFK